MAGTAVEPVKPAPGWKTTSTVPPEITRSNPVNSPGTWTFPSTSMIWPARAFAIAVVNWETVETTIALVRFGGGVSR